MSLFRSEAPLLGRGTQIHELSGAGGYPTAGNPTLNFYKPLTRLVISTQISAVIDTTANIVNYVFVAPFSCQLVKATFACVVAATSSATVTVYKVPLASQPEAATSGTAMTTAFNVDTGATANSQNVLTIINAPAATSICNAGDLVAIAFSATPAGLTGAMLQLEFVALP
jgi:hypothetical protein